MKSQRSQSIDAFRGLTIALMIFVNWTAGVSGLPAWMKHLPATADAFTYADWVFPGFLFAVGLSLPLALAHHPPSQFWRRLFQRSLSLIFIGVMMVNMEAYDAAATGLGQAYFALIFYAAVFAVWGTPEWLKWPRRAGLVTLVFLAFILRHKAEGGAVVGLRPEWWGILGMIGWSYFFAALSWKYSGSNRGRILQVLVYMSGLWILNRLSPLDQWLPLARVFDLAGLAGSHAALVMAGMFCGSLVQARHKNTARQSLIFGLCLLGAGFTARHWFPFSKIYGTISWSLACAGISAIAFAACRRIVDDQGKAWANWAIPSGKNALFAYLLPMLLSALFDALQPLGINLWGVFWWSWAGTSGALNALLWTGLMLWLTSLAARKGYFLKL